MVSNCRHNLQPTQVPDLKCKTPIKAEKGNAVESTDAPFGDKNANTAW